MAEVDSLEVKISADAAKASQAIDKLVKNIDSLANSLKSINTSAMSSATKSLSQNLSNINGKGFSELNKSAKEAQKTVNQISTTAKKGIKSKISFDTSEYQKAINVLGKKFSEAGKSFKPEGNLTGLEKQADKLSSKLENLLQKEDEIVSIGKTSPESSVFQNLQYNISETVNKIDIISSKIGELKTKAKDLSNIKINRWDEQTEKSTPITPKTIKIPASSIGYDKEAMDTIEKIASGADKAKEKTDSLGNKVDELKEKAGGSGGTFADRMRNALSDVNSSSSRTGNAMRSLSNSVKKAFNSMKKSSDGIGGFTKKIGLLYAKLYVLRRGFNSIFGTVKSSMDYIEDLNYFNAAFGQVAEKADLKSFKKMGYASAKEYYNSFSERAEKLTQKMSGFKIEESGLAVSTGEKSLGIDPSILMQNQAMFAQMSSSMGIASEMAGKLSSTFTRLGADIASLKNESFEKVWQNMASGMTGMSRAVDKYGMNIREANLQQTLANIGIDKSISKLGQQEKVLLRTIVMLEGSRAAWGDLSKTINQPANSIRLLQSNWNSLSRTIGNIFLPIVAKVLPYINAVTIMLQRFAEQIVKFLGFKDFDWGGLGSTGSAEIDFGDLADDTDSAADNMDKVAKKTKKASDNLQGFDIINKLTKDEDDKDKEDKKGLTPAEMSKLTGALDKLMEEYSKKWNEAFKKMENKANNLATKMQKALVSAWKKGDFSELGRKLAEWINKGLAKIPWNKIKATIKKIAKSIATFLNGFIKGIDWTLVGKTIAEGLNTAIDGAYEFWTTFDWLTFGESLAEGVRSFVDNFNAKKYGKLLGAKLRGVIQFAFGLLTNLPYKKIGKKFGDAINGFFEDMGEVRKNTGLTGWQELGQTISKSIVGILDTISVALATVKWEEVGKAIGQFLGNIEWGEILTKVGKVIVTALFTAIKIAFYAFKEDPAGVASALTAIFGAIFVYKKFKGLKAIFSTLFGTGMKKGITGVDGLESSFAQRIGKLTGSTKLQNACSKLGKVMNGWLALQIEGMAISGIGGALREWGEDSENKWLEDFGIGVERFGEFTTKLLSLDFKGVTGDLVKAGNVLQEIYDPSGAADKEDAKRKGNEKQQKENARIKDYIENYDKYKERYGQKYAENYIKSISNKEDKKNVEEYLSALKSLDSFMVHGKKGEDATKRGIELLNKSFDTGKISLSAYKSILSKTYNSYDEFNAELRQARNAQKYLNGDVKAFKKLGNGMNTSLKKIGYSSKELSGVQATLNMKLENGEISFEKYKEIVGKSYGSTKDLYNEVSKIAGKKVAAEVVANVKGASDVKNLENEIGKVNSKNVRVYAETNGITSIETLKTAIGNLSNKTISATISPKLRKDWYKLVQKELLAKTFTINAKTTTKNKITSEALKNAGVKSEEGKSIDFGKLASMLKKVDATWDQFGVLKVPKTAKDLIKYLNSKSIRYTTYKTGGFPEEGWFRASRDELIGQWDNGQSVVATNYQITEGIAQAVGPATYAAVKAAMNENRGGGNGTKDVLVLDKSYRQIAEGIIGEVNSMTRSKGKSPILGVN